MFFVLLTLMLIHFSLLTVSLTSDRFNDAFSTNKTSLLTVCCILYRHQRSGLSSGTWRRGMTEWHFDRTQLPEQRFEAPRTQNRGQQRNRRQPEIGAESPLTCSFSVPALIREPGAGTSAVALYRWRLQSLNQAERASRIKACFKIKAELPVILEANVKYIYKVIFKNQMWTKELNKYN